MGVGVGLGDVVGLAVEPDSGSEAGAAGVTFAPGVAAGLDVPAHAARITPMRRDAARRFAFICRRCSWCGLGHR